MTTFKQAEKMSLTDFRRKISSLCHAIRKNEKQLIVRKYYDDLFKVVAYDDDDKVGVRFGVTDVRESTPDFLELLETHGSVILTINNKPFATCIKL